MGHVYRRGKTWWIKYFVNGKANYESSRSDSQQAAEKLLKKKEGDVARGKKVSAKQSQFRFDEARDDLLNARRIDVAAPSEELKQRKLRNLKKLEGRIAKHLTPFFSKRRMEDIDTSLLRVYIRRVLKRATHHRRPSTASWPC